MQVRGLSNYDLSLSIYNCRRCSNNILRCTNRISCALVRIRILITSILRAPLLPVFTVTLPRAAWLYELPEQLVCMMWLLTHCWPEHDAQTITFPVSDGAILLNIPVRLAGVIFTCFFNVCFFTCFLVLTWLLSCKGILYFQVLSLCVWCTASSAFWHHRLRG